MKTLRMLIAGSVLTGLVACAAQAPQAETESILEVLDGAASAPAMEGRLVCAGSEVTYCEIDLGARHCACRDQGEMNRWLGRLYGIR